MIDLDIVAGMFQLGGVALMLAFPLFIVVMLVLIYQVLQRIEKKIDAGSNLPKL